MRKRFEEDLSKLAFGDLDAEEARRLEMRTLSDPEASQTFQTYCRMKEELRSLAQDVPADQLSKERLREAILNRGMKEQLPRTAKPTWIWMPAMAAVLAFGFMFVKGRLPVNGNHGPMVVVNSKTKPDFDLPVFNVKPAPPANTVAKSTQKSPLVVDKEPMKVASNSGRSSRSERYYDDISDRNKVTEEIPEWAEKYLKSQPEGEKEYAKTVSFESEREFSKPELGTSALGPIPGSSAVRPTIILIQSETDADTGTLKAREVSTANVVIGG